MKIKHANHYTIGPITDENKRLKRKFGQNKRNKSSDEGSSDKELDASKMLVQNLSLAPKRCTLQRMKLLNSTPQLIRCGLRLNRVPIIQKEQRLELWNKVQEFLMRDINSVVVPDEKKAEKGLRYRLIPERTLSAKNMCQRHILFISAISLKNATEKTDKELEVLFKKVNESGKVFQFLEWAKSKESRRGIY